MTKTYNSTNTQINQPLQLIRNKLSRNTSTANQTANSQLLTSHTSLHGFLHIMNFRFPYSDTLLNGSLVHGAHHFNVSRVSLVSYTSILNRKPYEKYDREHGRYDVSSRERGWLAHERSWDPSHSNPSLHRSPSSCSRAPRRTCKQLQAICTDYQEPWQDDLGHDDPHLHCSEWRQQLACEQSRRWDNAQPWPKACCGWHDRLHEHSWSEQWGRNHELDNLHDKTIQVKTNSSWYQQE